jgi:hypothetical protein
MKGGMIGPVRPSSSGYVHGAGAMHADMLLKSPSLGMPRSSGLSNPKTSLGPTGADERIIGRAVAYHSPASVGSKKGKAKVEKTMGEFKRGTLHSGSKTGPKVTGRKQAIAIALNQARKGK